MAKAAAKRKKIVEGEVAPLIFSGLTQGLPKQEALEAHPMRTKVDGRQVISHMRDADKRLDRSSGLPYAQFVAEDSTRAVWHDGVTERRQMDVLKTYTPEGMRLLREGRQCLRCDEPHPDDPFPVACDLCGYAMKDRQIMDIAMEFEGLRHLGPARPISEYLEEIEERTEKRRFIDRKIEGGSGRIPRELLRDAVLFPSGPPPQIA